MHVIMYNIRIYCSILFLYKVTGTIVTAASLLCNRVQLKSCGNWVLYEEYNTQESFISTMTTSIKNQPNLPWVVQKYGGTSVGKFLHTISSDITPFYLETKRVAIVCSARSGETKEKGTTNKLLKATQSALEGKSRYLSIVNEILQDHLSTARQNIQTPHILSWLENQLEKEIINLGSFLQATEILGELSPRSKDIVIGMGEKLACMIVAAALQDKGIDSELVVLNDIIDREFTVLDQEFYDYLALRMGDIIKRCGNRIPVITGFFGNVPGSLLTSVGRGYTDLCAALVAVGLNAHELQIWKEVDGIFTADPRKVKSARLLTIITPEEAAELTYYGSEVIHPFTMEQVIRSSIPIRIKNVENPVGQGTVVFPDIPNSIPSSHITPPLSPTFLAKNGYHSDLSRKSPSAITVKDNICIINIHSNKKSVSHGFLAKIFSTLDDNNIIIDLISTSEVHVSLVLGCDVPEHSFSKALGELKKLGKVNKKNHMAIVSLVGKQMKNTVGVAAEMFSALASANINIELISQGASEINISCVVKECDSITAMRVIHEKLLDAEPCVDSYF
ncbi:Aspartate/glutamate/uridylate kinase [Phycomyces blakesleeanus]